MADMGNLYVIAAPSGTGKTTLVKALVEALPNITVSISHTTRQKRDNEVHNVNYYFIDKDKFSQMVAHDDFLEHAVIFDHYYGTSKSYVLDTLQQGTDVILEIDWQGQQQIKHLYPQTISIFILPPSVKDLRARLTNRNQDEPTVIQKRLADAKITASHIADFDYIVINDDFTQAVEDLKIIVLAGRLQQKRQAAKFANIIQAFATMS